MNCILLTSPSSMLTSTPNLSKLHTAILSEPSVNAIFGVEADNLPDPDTAYWRMGYIYPLQLTDSALCMAPHHAVSKQFIRSLREAVSTNPSRLLMVDPVDITGPPALTAAVQNVAWDTNPDSPWDALSGRDGDQVGSRGKIIAGDTLILLITGFTPGRGWFHNMGSQSATHPNARSSHAATGSWRKMDLKVYYGKFCWTTSGTCRDWKKIPDL